MRFFSYHLVDTRFIFGLSNMFFNPKPEDAPGLIDMEVMTGMTLGAPVFSRSRILPNEIAVFAQWETESALDNFLTDSRLGQTLAKGWHTRLIFMRQWGAISRFNIPNQTYEIENPNSPVVAVTLAKMKLTQVPRFIEWGRPAEKLVRDHPGSPFALASIRFPQTVSTFSIWNSLEEMNQMTHGHSSDVSRPKRHSRAMKERLRKNFHYQFTTLRFKPISEQGEFQGKNKLIPEN